MNYHVLLATYKYPSGCTEIKSALVREELSKNLTDYFVQNGHLDKVVWECDVNIESSAPLDPVYLSM